MGLSSSKRVTGILSLLILLRLAMVAGMVMGLPETPNHVGWLFHHGGDQATYISASLALLRFQPGYSLVNIGFPLFLAPFLWLTGSTTFAEIVAPVAIFSGCLLFPLSIVLEFLVARRLTGDERAALLASGLWTLLPYLIYAAGYLASPFRPQWIKLGGVWAAHYMWLQVLSDPPATFIILFLFYALARSFDQHAASWGIIAGLLAGLAFLFRPVNMVAIATVGLIYLWQRKIRLAFYFAVATVAAVTPEFLYDTLFSHARFSAAIVESAGDFTGQWKEGTPLFSPTLVVRLLSRVYGISNNIFIIFIFSVTLLLLMGGFIMAVLHIWRRRRLMGGVLGAWVLSFLALYANYFAFQYDVGRHLMPILPALCIIAAVDLLMLWRWLEYRLSPDTVELATQDGGS
jgi:hypothetical protein